MLSLPIPTPKRLGSTSTVSGSQADASSGSTMLLKADGTEMGTKRASFRVVVYSVAVVYLS